MAESIFCIAHSEAEAESIVTQLKESGFSYEDISVLFPDKNSPAPENTKLQGGAITGAGTGGMVGGALGWLAGIGALTIPGLGPFVAAGPILMALSGAAFGAAIGGIAATLIGMGVPEVDARHYESKVKSGGVLISAFSETEEEIRLARKIFQDCGAQDIATSRDAAMQDGHASHHSHRGPSRTL